MGYTIDDLGLFEPRFDPAALKGTSYFELHPKEVPAEHSCWLPGSLFLQDAAFDFFTTCFQSANQSFDHFSFMRFGEIEIERVIIELDVFLNVLVTNPSRTQVFANYASIFSQDSQDIWSGIDTVALVRSVRTTGQQMRDFIQSNTRQTKCLWILGM